MPGVLLAGVRDEAGGGGAVHGHWAQSAPRAASTGRRGAAALPEEYDRTDKQEDEDERVEGHDTQHGREVCADFVKRVGHLARERDGRRAAVPGSSIVGNIVVCRASTNGVKVR